MDDEEANKLNDTADTSFKSDVFIEEYNSNENHSILNDVDHVLNIKTPNIHFSNEYDKNEAEDEVEDEVDVDDDENYDYEEELEDEEYDEYGNMIEKSDSKFSTEEDNNQTSLEHICLSPPQNSRTLKKAAATRNRNSKHNVKLKTHTNPNKPKTKPKRPAFKNSAANLDITVDNESLTDSLTNMQEEHLRSEQLQNQNQTFNNIINDKPTTTSSAPPTASVITSNNSMGFDKVDFNYWTDSTKSRKSIDKINTEMDPNDRKKSYEKISSLLKLALRNHQTKPNFLLETYLPATKCPPSTPATSMVQNNKNNSIFHKTIYSTQNSESSHQPVFSFYNSSHHNHYKDEQTRQMAHENAEKVFKNLYDFFVHYDDRADNDELVDIRLKEARKIIPFTIKDVINTNFGAITHHMDNEIKKSMKSPSDYSLLYEHKSYIDQLCYLYWLVEEMLNRITYIETLYPSTNAMKKDQPAYAGEKFDSTYKTLLLWYKIMTGLLNGCDLLGRYLGFGKKENLQYWTWFDQRLKYSKSEFECVQKWIDESFQDIEMPSVNSDNNLKIDDDQFNNSNSTLVSNDQAQKRPSLSLNYPIKQITKHQRQISFELKSSNTLFKLHLESPSIRFENVDDSSIYTINSNISDSNKNSTSASNLNRETSSSLSHQSSSVKNNIGNTTRNNNTNNQEAYENLLINSLKESNLLNDNIHLTPAKLHHLDSFISRTASLRSNTNDSQSPSSLSQSFYNSLLDNQNINSNTSNMNNNNEENSYSKVEFNLFDECPNETITVPIPEKCIEKHNYHTISFENNEQEDNDLQKIQKNHEIDPIVYTNRQKILGEFLKKRLTKHGLTKTIDEIRRVVLDKLPYVLQALQVDRCERNLSGVEDNFYYHLMPLHHKCKDFIDNFKIDEETIKYGCKSDTFRRLELPSFRPLYMYISNIVLELMHLCLRILIDNNLKNKRCKYSLLSIEVLCNECRECIEQAILVRQFYFHMVVSVFERNEIDIQTALESSLVTFDNDLKEIINIYLNFITDWVHDLVANLDLSKALWVLKDEWAFCKNNLYFVTASEDMYAKRFCTLCGQVTASLLDTISFIDLKHKQPLMEYVTKMEMDQELGSFDEDNSNTVSQEKEIEDEEEEEEEEEYSNTFEVHNQDDENEVERDIQEDEDENNLENAQEKRKRFGRKSSINKTNHFDANLKCNEFKDEINQLRKSCMKALDFCANLFSDLELAAKYEVKSPIQKLLDELKSSNYVLVEFTNPELQSTSFKNTIDIDDYQTQSESQLLSNTSTETIKGISKIKSPSFMIFVPYEFSKDKVQIVRLLFIISEKDDFEIDNSNLSSTKKPSENNNNNNNNNNNDQIETNRIRNKSESESKIDDYYPGVRRLSSSNSFLDMNIMMNKLSKIAQINTNKQNKNGQNISHGISKDSSKSDQPSAFILSPNNKTDGYLLYVKLPKDVSDKFEWTGHTISLFASMPVRKSLYQHKNITNKSTSANLILVTPRQEILLKKQIELKNKFQGTINLVKEKTSFHPNIEYAIDELKDNILKLRDESVQFIRLIEKDLKNSIHFHNDDKNTHMHVVIDQRYLSEIWRVSYNFGIELQNECIKFMTHDRAEIFSLGLAEFSILWSNYIVDKTERGKGRTVRPWAAKKGIQLMQEACNHSNNLRDADFARLIMAVEQCILHVIGDRGSSKISPSITSNSSYHDIKISRSFTVSNRLHRDSLIDHQRKSEPELVESEKRKSISLSRHSLHLLHSKRQNAVKPPSERFSEQCQLTDIDREKNLLQKRYIGKILDQQKIQRVIPVTEVNFRWQLGLLIGEGQYGKVYSCVNLETGESMAMKEIPFKSNDINAIKELADEINNVQGIIHENLVKFYGAELHRKEILIFMEFCGDNCTLDRISRESSGLPEKIVRDHTKSLLKAVEKLHENNIMHRDIKGANIFLKVIDSKHPEKTVLKLGDFGCSIKFKDPIGPIAGPARATGFMGTFPFMAPEVMVSGGATDKSYTFTADIWSIGCVVIEMFTGKRPWHPLSDQNIVFKVHILQEPKPPYPTNNISDEATNFLDSCLEFDQDKRPSAEQLLEHAFVKVPINDEKYESI